MGLMQPQGGGRGMRRVWVKRVVVLLVVLNFIQALSFFFHPAVREEVGIPRPVAVSARQVPGKPWPRLSSFTSWTLNPELDQGSCEAFFGNGFTQAFQLLDQEPRANRTRTRSRSEKEGSSIKSKLPVILGNWRRRQVKQVNVEVQVKTAALSDELQEARMQRRSKIHQPPLRDGLFQCFYSNALETSICEGTNMIMYPKKIKMSKGGEPLDSVIGRNEEEELPYFTSGAFQVMVPESAERRALFNKSMLERLIPEQLITEHTLHHLFEQIRTIPLDEVICAQRVSQPTIVVTRFEYANLFHTVTDWYSAYMTSRIANLKKRPRLIFVDGHCKSPLDDGWQAMFSGVNFARHLTGPVCFDHVIFAPLGYNTPLFRGLNLGLSCAGCAAEDIPKNPRHNTARLREFGEFFTAAFNITSEIMPPKDSPTVVKVLFVRREDYLAHPRHTGKPESRLSNEAEVLEALQSWAASRSGANSPQGMGELNIVVVNGLLAHMTLEEQLHTVQESSIIVGAHGAGLSHVLFVRPEKTAILELVSPYFVRPHFEVMSQWMGTEYHKIEMVSSEADCSEVTSRIDQIFLGLVRRQVIP